MLRAMQRYRDRLDRLPGLAAGRLMWTAEMDPVTGGRPTLTRWGLLCGWADREARDDFVETWFAPFLSDAREWWAVGLDTVRVVQGQLWGWQPTSDGVERLAPGETLAVLTYGKVRARYLPTFTTNNRRVVRELDGNPGQLMRIGLGEHPMARCTFSLWRSQRDVVRFAYGEGIHKPVQRESLDAPWAHDYFFARFRPVTSRGTWGGRDPLTGSRVGNGGEPQIQV
jgi:hypothetical protein